MTIPTELAQRGEVAVLGLGKSGAAAARLLRSWELSVYASDRSDSEAIRETARGLREIGAAVDVGSHDLPRIRRARVVVVSPGISPTAAPLKAAIESGVPVWAEAELGLRALGRTVRFAAITGTNGKTTTTGLVAHLLASSGIRSVAGGNIGTPLSEIALESERPEAMAVELSSFQLHDMPTLSPTVGVLTNLAPDHLDRYTDLGEYYRDKMRLFANANASSIWITNADDHASREWVVNVRGTHKKFSLRESADGWWDVDSGWLMLGRERLIARDKIQLLGNHNVANALAAALAADALGASPSGIVEGLATARALPHRLEPVREVEDILWINDSKATNIASTWVALEAMNRPYVLLLGGRHKGEPYTVLKDGLHKCRAVVAYGEARPLIVADLQGIVPVVEASDFLDVLQKGWALAQPGDAILLSPACSSYDMFTNYEERGAVFRSYAEAR